MAEEPMQLSNRFCEDRNRQCKSEWVILLNQVNMRPGMVQVGSQISTARSESYRVFFLNPDTVGSIIEKRKHCTSFLYRPSMTACLLRLPYFTLSVEYRYHDLIMQVQYYTRWRVFLWQTSNDASAVRATNMLSRKRPTKYNGCLRYSILENMHLGTKLVKLDQEIRMMLKMFVRHQEKQLDK